MVNMILFLVNWLRNFWIAFNIQCDLAHDGLVATRFAFHDGEVLLNIQQGRGNDGFPSALSKLRAPSKNTRFNLLTT